MKNLLCVSRMSPARRALSTPRAASFVAPGIFAIAAITALAQPLPAQTWTATGSMTVERAYHRATLLNDGQVLIDGGQNNSGVDYSSAELYDPTTGTFTATGSMTEPRALHTATLLHDGKVLIVGGCGPACVPGSITSTAELYDPTTGTFAATGSMAVPRSTHTATLLHDGKVLVAGGQDGYGTDYSSAELYDPATGTFTVTGSMTQARYNHTATLLRNGQVLIAGGTVNGDSFPNNTTLASAELYDPATGTFTAAGSMTQARYNHTATRLKDDQVLMAGGAEGNNSLASAELYDPITETFTATESMTSGRLNGSATLLNNGRVLTEGGESSVVLASAELYHHKAGTFTATGSMTSPRALHTATLLLDGTVLVTGGNNGSGSVLASAEIYTPK